MADPISVASGIITFVVFAIESSKVLSRTIKSLKSHKKLRELQDELDALDVVLQTLRDTASTTNRDLKALELPLNRCGKACQDFNLIIAKCTTDSGGIRAIRDWAKVQYLGSDITDFRALIESYKSTITIAICDLNIRSSMVTTSLLQEYQQMIDKTTTELEEQLDGMNQKLEYLSVSPSQASSVIGDYEQISNQDRDALEEDKKSIERCLQICFQIADSIQNIQNNSILSFTQTIPSSNNSNAPLSARHITINTINGCKNELFTTVATLQSQLKNVQARLTFPSNETQNPRDIFEENKEGLRQCLNICETASSEVKQNRVNIFEDIKISDNGQQIIVSTIGDLITAKRVTAGTRSMQVFGQMSDASLQSFANRSESSAPGSGNI